MLLIPQNKCYVLLRRELILTIHNYPVSLIGAVSKQKNHHLHSVAIRAMLRSCPIRKSLLNLWTGNMHWWNTFWTLTQVSFVRTCKAIWICFLMLRIHPMTLLKRSTLCSIWFFIIPNRYGIGTFIKQNQAIRNPECNTMQ